MKFRIAVLNDFDEEEYKVFCDGIDDLYGYGETESSALLDFLQKYETSYSGFKCFSQKWVQNQISALTLAEKYETWS